MRADRVPRIQWCNRNDLMRFIRYYLRPAESIIDIGCGVRPQELVDVRFHICVEPFEQYVRELVAKRPDTPMRVVIQTTAQNAVEILPERSADAVFLLDVIEHLDKDEARKVIDACTLIGRKQVVIFTPLGYMTQAYLPGDKDAWGLDGIHWQTHRSGWLPEDFDERWRILACEDYHQIDSKGNALDEPHGALWAVLNVDEEERREDGPLVSVIITVRNRVDLLDETITSILAQDYPKIECFLSDRGSTDGTLDVVKSYEDRILWETFPGISRAEGINAGLSRARGDICVVIEADAPLLPEAVSKGVAVLRERPDAVVAHPDWVVIDGYSNTMSHREATEDDYVSMVRQHRIVVGPGAFFRKEAAKIEHGLDPEFPLLGWSDFWLRLGLHGTFARVPETLATARYRPATQGDSCEARRWAAEHVRMMRRYFRRPDLLPEIRAVRRAALAAAHMAATNCSGRSRWTAFSHCVAAFLLSPLDLLFRREDAMTKQGLRCLRWALRLGKRALRRAARAVHRK